MGRGEPDLHEHFVCEAELFKQSSMDQSCDLCCVQLRLSPCASLFSHASSVRTLKVRPASPPEAVVLPKICPKLKMLLTVNAWSSGSLGRPLNHSRSTRKKPCRCRAVKVEGSPEQECELQGRPSSTTPSHRNPSSGGD